MICKTLNMGKILWVVGTRRIIPWDTPKFRIWGTKTVDLERIACEAEVKPRVSCCPRNQFKKKKKSVSKEKVW